MPDSNKIKVLVIDDDEDDFFILKSFIEDITTNQFIVHWCDNYNDALIKIKSGYYSIFFVDYRLGNETGLELLQEAVRSGCEEPIIVLTGKGNKATDIEAMRLGATDYLVKSELNHENLERCIRYSLERSVYIKSLKQSEKKYRNLFEGSKDAVFIADRGLKFRETNSATSGLLGMSIDELLDLTLYAFIHEEKQQAMIRYAINQQQQISDIEIELEDKNKVIKNCLLSLTLETDDEDQQFVYGIIHDITDLKSAARTNLQMEKLAANERLIRIIAHEVRNPLTNIRLAIDHLQLMDADKDNEVYIGMIKRNSIRINQLISELLDFSKPIELISDRISLQEIIDTSLLNTGDRLQLQGTKVLKEYADTPLFIMADKSKLVMAFSNMIINAIEAMDKDEGALAIRIGEYRDCYSINIQDNGKGIPAEFLSRISEPFFTLKRNGMGIGLAAAYAILRSHKAKMEVKSKPGEGTEFVINFEKTLLTNAPQTDIAESYPTSGS